MKAKVQHRDMDDLASLEIEYSEQMITVLLSKILQRLS